jgi:hypothetical protein
MMKIHRYLSSERKTRHGMRLSILPSARAGRLRRIILALDAAASSL